MRDGTVIKQLPDINAEIQEFFDLRYLVVKKVRNIAAIEKTAVKKKIDIIIIKDLAFTGSKDYFLKPKKIRNILETKDIPDDVLEHLKKEKRKRIRQLSEKGVTITIIENLDDKRFKRWLDLYHRSIEDKEKGLEHASITWLNKKRRLKQKVTGIFAFLDYELIGGSVLNERRLDGKTILTSGYKAVTPEFAKEGLSDLLAYSFIRYGKKKGYKIISSGSDTNFFGHHLKAGLFLFKRHWGYSVIPEDELEFIKIINYSKLDDIIVFCSGKDELAVNVIFKKDVDKNRMKEFESSTIPKIKFYKVKGKKLCTVQLYKDL